MNSTYPLIPCINFLSAVLVLISIIPRSIQRPRNAGLLMLALWVFIASLLRGINAIVWSNTAQDIAPVFCDICQLLSYLVTLLMYDIAIDVL